MRADGWRYFTKLNAQTNFLNIVMNTTPIVMIIIDLFKDDKKSECGNEN